MNRKHSSIIFSWINHVAIVDVGISSYDLIVIRQWIMLVEKHGPEKLDESKFWNDHALDREKKWKNCRSSSFSFSGRIIYKVINKKIVVEVVRITNEHNYK